MNADEKFERYKYMDPRVYLEIQKIKKEDNSYTVKGLFGPPSYKQREVREIYLNAIGVGMLRGIEIGSIQGQRIDLTNSCKEPRQKEFLEKFYKLAEEYNCAIIYHPNDGMVVMDLNRP